MPTLKLEYESNKRPVVTLKINGTNYRFLLDTGATHTILHPKMATELLHIHRKQSINMTGIGEAVSVLRLHVQFNFVCKSISNVIVSDRGAELQSHTAGLIGQDILQQFSSIVFDNVHRVVIFNL